MITAYPQEVQSTVETAISHLHIIDDADDLFLSELFYNLVYAHKVPSCRCVRTPLKFTTILSLAASLLVTYYVVL